MKLYRIANSAFASTTADAFSGQGALYGSGRWHHRGCLIVYTASHVSLALLEVIAHIDKNHIPKLILWTLDVPDALIQPAQNIPNDWKTDIDATRAYGMAWLKSSASVGLIVPSVIVPAEQNVLLNPKHPDFSLNWVPDQGTDITIDHRLIK